MPINQGPPVINQGAPVCNEPTQQIFPTPQVPAFPPIPIAHDLASAITAINAMRQGFMLMTGQVPHNNHSGAGRGGGGFKSTPGKPNKKNDQSSKQSLQDFTEIRPERVVETVRVFNPDDHTQFVDVDQITGVVFGNKAGQKLKFSQ